MIGSDDVKKLALLSRIALSEDEVAKFQSEINSIVAYIDTIQKVELSKIPEGTVYLDNINVMREDANPHEPGIHTEELLAQAARREGQYLKVKKILG